MSKLGHYLRLGTTQLCHDVHLFIFSLTIPAASSDTVTRKQQIETGTDLVWSTTLQFAWTD
jgi:hypothetical protein